MASRVLGPLIVVGIYTLAGGLIGADIALWPWDDPISLSNLTTLGATGGFIAGVLIVWVVREVEALR